MRSLLLPRTLCLVVVAQAGVALADEPAIPFPLEPREKAPQITTLRSVHLRELAHRDAREETPEPNAGRERGLDRFQFAKGGLKYQDRFEFNNKRYRFSVRGPVQKGSQFGLTFELRF
jgi:hypothetical protein